MEEDEGQNENRKEKNSAKEGGKTSVRVCECVWVGVMDFYKII